MARRFVEQGADPDRVLIFGPLDDPLNDLTAIVREVGPDVVVPDTLPTFVSSMIEGSADTAWSKIMSGFTAIAHDYNCAVLLPTHSKKNDAGQYRDSNRIGAGVDMILAMEEQGSDATVRTIKPKGRSRLAPYSVRLCANGLYELASGELSLEAQVMVAVHAVAGIPKNKVRAKVTGKAENTYVDGAQSDRVGAHREPWQRRPNEAPRDDPTSSGHTSGHTR